MDSSPGFKNSEMMELELTCKDLMSEAYRGLQFKDEKENEDENKRHEI